MAKHAITLASCKCRSAWCENEYCRGAALERLYEGGRTGSPVGWDWRKVRHFWLTVDREQFDGPADAYDSTKGDISYVMQRIRSQIADRGLVVQDYLKVLEWHADGYPHWHYLVLVNKAGRYGQIGYDVIAEAWEHGLVQERYIKDRGHWAAMAGYQAKRGYIGKAKNHQVTLPDWALQRESGTIRKGSRAHKRRCSTDDETDDTDGSGNEENTNMERVESRNNRRTYAARLQDCDKGSRMLDMDRQVVYDLPLAACDIRDVIIPELMQEGKIYSECYTENKGYVLLFETPERVTSRKHAMDYLWSCMRDCLEELSGFEIEPDWGDRVRSAMAKAEVSVVEGVA